MDLHTYLLEGLSPVYTSPSRLQPAQTAAKPHPSLVLVGTAKWSRTQTTNVELLQPVVHITAHEITYILLHAGCSTSHAP